MTSRIARIAVAVLVPASLLVTACGAFAADGLAFLQVTRNGSGVDGLKTTHGIAVSPDGTSVYATGEDDDAVVVFQRDAQSGALAFAGRQKNGVGDVIGLDQPRGVVVSPDGLNVYAAAARGDAVVAFTRNPGTGRLSFLERELNGFGDVFDLDGPDGLAISPDGLHVYAAATVTSSVVVFTRDPTTGGLRYVETQTDNIGGVSGLSGAQAVVVSPDGAHVYVAAPDDKSVVVFRRDPATGKLTFLERQRDNTNGVDGLDSVRSLAISPDGAHLYASGKLDKALAVFSRNAGSGLLTFVTRYVDTADGVEGLDGIDGVVVSPDGAHVYAVGADADSVATFVRDAATGELTYLGRQRDGRGTVDGLQNPHGLAVSPDNAQLYVTSQDASAILTFGTACGDGQLGAGEQCDDGNGKSGDGCSAGCRVECQAASECEDGDTCTEARCRDTECARPRCGFTGGLCELADQKPALIAIPQCTGRGAHRLARSVRVRMKQAQHQLRAASRQGANSKTVADKLKTLLNALKTKADKLETAHAIDTRCHDALTNGVDEMTRTLPPIVQRKGLCPA